MHTKPILTDKSSLTKEGLSIRSTERVLKISTTTLRKEIFPQWFAVTCLFQANMLLGMC